MAASHHGTEDAGVQHLVHQLTIYDQWLGQTGRRMNTAQQSAERGLYCPKLLAVANRGRGPSRLARGTVSIADGSTGRRTLGRI